MTRLPIAARAALLCLCLLIPAAGARAARAPSSAPGVHHYVPPVRGGTLIDGLLEQPDHLLPNFSRRFAALLVQQVLFAPLFYSDDHGTIRPGLCEQVPTRRNGGISADGRSYTFRLRPNLRWSDGRPLTARDVDFSWRLWTNPQTAASVASTLGFDRIGGTTIGADGRSITFRLVAPFAPFLATWSDAPGPLPAHILARLRPRDILQGRFAQDPDVNSGPFTLSAAAHGTVVPAIRQGSSIAVVRNRFYYRAAQGYPYLDAIVFRILRGRAALQAAIRAHAVDAAWLLPLAALDPLRALPGYRVLPLRDANWEAAIINLRRPLFQDVRIRQALQYGLDRSTLIDGIWRGLAAPIGSDQPLGSPVYTPQVAAYPYDPVLAGRLLDQAGWRLRVDGFRHRGTAILRLTYSTTFNNPWRHAGEAEVLNSYERLGIQVIVVNYPAQVFLTQVLPNGAFDLAENAFNNGLDPDDSAAFGTRFTYPRGTNYGAYSNPEFDRMAAQELVTADPGARAALFVRMQRLLHDDAPVVWLYSPYDLAVVSRRVYNYRPSPFSQDTWNAWQWFLGPPARP